MDPTTLIPPERAMRAFDLLKIEFPPNRCYIEPNILTKGGTLLLGGEAKAGKSFLMLEAIRALTTGTKFMGTETFKVPEPVKVMYLEQENGYPTNQDRIRKIFQEEHDLTWQDNFYIRCKDLRLHLNSSEGFERIARRIEEEKPNVLILDPISYFSHSEESSNTEVGKLFYKLSMLKEIGKEQEMSLILAHHFGKRPWGEAAKGWDALSEYNFRGASKWKDGGDSLITLQRFNTVYHPYEHWDFKARFLTRHGSSPPEATFNFNQKGDLRVRFDHWNQLQPLEKAERQAKKAKTKFQKINMETVEGEIHTHTFKIPDPQK